MKKGRELSSDFIRLRAADASILLRIRPALLRSEIPETPAFEEAAALLLSVD